MTINPDTRPFKSGRLELGVLLSGIVASSSISTLSDLSGFFIGCYMTKAEHKQRAMEMAYQVRHCYSRVGKRKMAQECLEALRKSLKGFA